MIYTKENMVILQVNSGIPIRLIAENLGVNLRQVYRIIKRHEKKTGCKLNRVPYSRPPVPSAIRRRLEIINAYHKLGSLAAAGRQFGLSRERVRQIVARHKEQFENA